MHSKNTKTFGSDNQSGVHPRVLAALSEANQGHCSAYGADAMTAAAEALFEKVFARPLKVYFVFTGTAANSLAIRTLCQSYEAVLSTDIAHIQEDECGAPEWVSSCKLISSPHREGKLDPRAIETLRIRPGDPHRVAPRLVSITQASEVGTVYSRDEIRALADAAHQRSLLLHMDGARLANAAVHLGCSLAEVTEGVDVLSFGGTKNGLMCGEALVFFRPELAQAFPYYRKQNMQLASKMRFLASQFIPYLGEDLWRSNARRANETALYLRARLSEIKAAFFPYPTEANEVFVQLPAPYAARLQAASGAYTWDESSGLLRLVTSFDMERSDIDTLMESVLAKS